MILSDKDIKAALKTGKIIVKPTPDLKTQLGSSSLDLRLGYHFLVFKHRKQPFVDPLDPATTDGMTEEVIISKNEPYVIHPNEFVLGSTLEWVEWPNDLAARIEGRSSLGRMGLVIHSTASHIDAGWRGVLTLELRNIGMVPILLHPKMRICQLMFEPLSSPADQPYYLKKGAQYFGRKSTTESASGAKNYK
ncbi:MAG: dCTP deaminase [Candidatus Curtissbacteria bacterium]|nr:dCTP deaminase [bacterium]MDZ4209929.1 dCTP deaminase [Candidatus Curtissbacteria bacterium]